MNNGSFDAYREFYGAILRLSEQNKERYGCPIPFIEESELREELKTRLPVFSNVIFNTMLQ